MALTPDWIGRQGDTGKPFPFVCQDANGPVDISSAVHVMFHLARKPGVTALIDSECVNVDYSVGEGEYQWATGETDDLLGFYYAEVEIEWPDGTFRTFPEGVDAQKRDKYAILYFSRQLA